MTAQPCTWCDRPYEPRVSGGQPQRFCSEPCRTGFHTACREWAEAEVWAGNLSVATLKQDLEQRTRCVEANLAQAAELAARQVEHAKAKRRGAPAPKAATG